MSPLHRAVVGVLLIALAIAGCGTVETTPAGPTPADFGGIISEFAKRGLIATHAVSGDAGCTDPVLIPTAIGFDAKGLDQPTTVRVYLYIFNNRSAFERLRPTIDTCARSFVTDPQTYQSIDQSPFVVAGQGPWGAAFEKALRDGLAVAAGSGDKRAGGRRRRGRRATGPRATRPRTRFGPRPARQSDLTVGAIQRGSSDPILGWFLPSGMIYSVTSRYAASRRGP